MVSIPPSSTRTWEQWSHYLQTIQTNQNHALQLHQPTHEHDQTPEEVERSLRQLQASVVKRSGIQLRSPTVEYLLSHPRSDADPLLVERALELIRTQHRLLESSKPDPTLLTFVDLTAQLLVSIGALAHCINLRACVLARNHICDITPVVQKCTHLEWLDAHSNQIVKMPPEKAWSKLRALRILNLHDNLVNDLISVRQVSGCASLELLTLYDTPISTQPNYRHFAVNVIQTLSALDHFVISDEEIIEEVDFAGTRFCAITLPFRCSLTPRIRPANLQPGHHGSKLAAARYAQLQTLARVHAVQKHFSPVTIIQRFFRGFRVRLRLLAEAYDRRVLPFPPSLIASFRRPPPPAFTAHELSSVRVPLPGTAASASATAAGAPGSFEPTTPPVSRRSLSLQTDTLPRPAALQPVLFEERLPLSRTRTSTSVGAIGSAAMSGVGVVQPPPSARSPPPPVASGFRHSRTTARTTKAPTAQPELVVPTAGAFEKGALDEFASDERRPRAQAYERSTLQRMLQVKTSPSKLLAKMLLAHASTRAQPMPRRVRSAGALTSVRPAAALGAEQVAEADEEHKREQLLFVPFRVGGAAVEHLDVVIEAIVERFRESQEMRAAVDEWHREQEEREEARADAAERRVARIDAEDRARAHNKKRLVQQVAGQHALPLHALLEMEHQVYGVRRKRERLERLAEDARAARQEHNTIKAGLEEYRLEELRRARDQAERDASHRDVERERKRREQLALNVLHARVVRKWEEGRKQALRAERQFARQFGAKQLSIGQTLFRHDLRTIREAGEKSRHQAAQEAEEREDSMRTQIRRFMKEERADRHEERRREHLALDLACVQRYNDELCDSRDRCENIRTTHTRHDPLLPHASGVSLSLPRTHLPVLPTFISTYISTLESDFVNARSSSGGSGSGRGGVPPLDTAPPPEEATTVASAATPALVTLTSTSAANPPRPLRVRRARLRREMDRMGRVGGDPTPTSKTDTSLFGGPREGYKAPCASSVSKGDANGNQQQEEQEPDQDDWDTQNREGEAAATEEREPATAVDDDEEQIEALKETPPVRVSEHLSAVPSEDQGDQNSATGLKLILDCNLPAMASSRAALAGKAVKDCVRLVKTHDYPNFLASILIKDKQCQRAVFAVHAFNNAITSIPNQARDLKTRQLRFQFWLDALNQVYSNPKFVPEPSSANASKAQPLASTSASEASQPPSQRPMEPADMPIAVALQTPVLSELHWAVHTFGITRKWLSRVITARRVLVEHTAPLSNALANTHPLHGLMVGPFRSIADMEQYCERTFVGPMLASLEALRIRDVHTDHIASHVGQMLGIVSRLKAIPPLLINQNTVLLPIDLLMEKVPQLDYGPAIALRKSVTDKSVFRWSIEMQKIMNVLGTQFEPVVSALANRALDHFTIARELIERGSSARDVHAIPPGATAAPPPPAQPLPEAQRSQRPGATSTTAASPSASSSGKQSPFAAAQAMSGATPKQQTRSGPQSVESSQLQQQTQPKTDLKQTERERRDRLARAFPVYLPALHAYDYLRALDRAKYNVFDLRPISSARQHPVFLPISYSYHNWKMRL